MKDCTPPERELLKWQFPFFSSPLRLRENASQTGGPLRTHTPRCCYNISVCLCIALSHNAVPPPALRPDLLGQGQLADRDFKTWGDYVTRADGYTWTLLQTLQEMPTFTALDHHLLQHHHSHGKKKCRRNNNQWRSQGFIFYTGYWSGMSVLVRGMNLACSSLEDWEASTNKAPWGSLESLFPAVGQREFFLFLVSSS